MRRWFQILPLLLLPFVMGCNEDPAGLPPQEGQVIRLPSGLSYIEVEAGRGAPAVAGRVVRVHYTGYLAADSTQFDTSYDDTNQPLSFVLSGTGNNAAVVRGFNEGIIGMRVGGKRRLFIPAALGYGAAGSPPSIPANADLIFDVELFSVSGG